MAVPRVPLTDELPPPMLELIAKVVVTFGHLEHVLKLVLKRELRVSYHEGMAEAERIRHLNALRARIAELVAQRVMNQAVESEVDAALKETEALYEKRHDVIHAVWTMENGELRYSRNGRRPPDLRDLRTRTRRAIAGLNQLLPPRRP